MREQLIVRPKQRTAHYGLRWIIYFYSQVQKQPFAQRDLAETPDIFCTYSAFYFLHRQGTVLLFKLSF